MSRYFHGTTREQAERILSNECKEDITWNCSDDNYLYLWCPEALAECNGDEDEAEVYKVERAINNAFESAQITASLADLPQSELVVLEFCIDSDYVEMDHSHDTMDYARCTRLDDYSAVFKREFTCKHNSRLDALVLNSLLDNKFINSDRISDDMRKACEALQGVQVDSLDEFDYVETL
tara:strand:- start:507 stop:1043 length:537 start_codon:yes stop_codon:yes gene_type:complete